MSALGGTQLDASLQQQQISTVKFDDVSAQSSGPIVDGNDFFSQFYFGGIFPTKGQEEGRSEEAEGHKSNIHSDSSTGSATTSDGLFNRGFESDYLKADDVSAFTHHPSNAPPLPPGNGAVFNPNSLNDDGDGSRYDAGARMVRGDFEDHAEFSAQVSELLQSHRAVPPQSQARYVAKDTSDHASFGAFQTSLAMYPSVHGLSDVSGGEGVVGAFRTTPTPRTDTCTLTSTPMLVGGFVPSARLHNTQFSNVRSLHASGVYGSTGPPHYKGSQALPSAQHAYSPSPTVFTRQQHAHVRKPRSQHGDAVSFDLRSLEDSSVEDVVAKCCLSILSDAANHTLKAVELANTLRARVGTDVLAHVRERWGGLLSLLERHPTLFRVERIPKNDIVMLAGSRWAGSRSDDTFAPQSLLSAGQNQSFNQGLRSYHGDQQKSMLKRFGQQPHDIKSIQALHSQQPYEQRSDDVPSKCLLLESVPAQISEAQLYLELERYGEVEGMRLMTLNGHRFALVAFTTVEQAVAAKQRLQKHPVWIGAVSFSQMDTGRHSAPAAPYVSGPPPGLTVNFLPISQYSSESGVYDRRGNLQADSMRKEGYVSTAAASQATSFGGPAPSILSPPRFPPQQVSATYPEVTQLSSAGLGMRLGMGTGPPYRDAVIARLCDDSYVSQQMWPVDPVADAPFCNAIASHLQHIGGCATIPELKGLFREYLDAGDNISTAPLKAMLCAYPSSFLVRGNQVWLTSSISMDIDSHRQHSWF